MISRQTIRHESQWPQVYKWLDRYRTAQKIPKSGLEFTIGPPRRSNPQNRYLWGVAYKTLAEGMTEQSGMLVKPEWVHELCKQHFMPRVDVPGTGKSVPMSTTELCRSGDEGFQDYVMQIQELAAKKGIYIPDPNEEQA